MKIKFMY